MYFFGCCISLIDWIVNFWRIFSGPFSGFFSTFLNYFYTIFIEIVLWNWTDFYHANMWMHVLPCSILASKWVDCACNRESSHILSITPYMYRMWGQFLEFGKFHCPFFWTPFILIISMWWMWCNVHGFDFIPESFMWALLILRVLNVFNLMWIGDFLERE